jgi:uncharacterized surface protein with fasciclin (FAS1) repeats
LFDKNTKTLNKMKNSNYSLRRISFATALGLFSQVAIAQTNVFDDVIAASPNHTSLEAALIAAGLDDDLQNPAGTFTVFAPDDAAFNDLANQLGVTVPDLLTLPNLEDILLYHVLGTTVNAASVTNGAIATPLFNGNSLKLTKTSTNSVYVNHAMVTTADLSTSNGIVHSINAVLMSSETVIDVALDNGFTTLATAVIQEELVPVLSDPFAQFTVFAPTNTAFTDLATELNTNLAGILALPNLSSILTYHVLPVEALSTSLMNGPVATVNGANVIITVSPSVKVNDANVTTADVQADNGVVHVIDKVLLETYLGINNQNIEIIEVYPNPTEGNISLKNMENASFTVYNTIGQAVASGVVSNNTINLSNLESGMFTIHFSKDSTLFSARIVKQ